MYITYMKIPFKLPKCRSIDQTHWVALGSWINPESQGPIYAKQFCTEVVVSQDADSKVLSFSK